MLLLQAAALAANAPPKNSVKKFKSFVAGVWLYGNIEKIIPLHPRPGGSLNIIFYRRVSSSACEKMIYGLQPLHYNITSYFVTRDGHFNEVEGLLIKEW